VLWLLEVRAEKVEGKTGSGKKARKSFRYLGIEREFGRLAALAPRRFARGRQDSYPRRILGLVRHSGRRSGIGNAEGLKATLLKNHTRWVFKFLPSPTLEPSAVALLR
jgi:hypothetical protein